MTTQRRTVSAVIVFSRGWLLPSMAMSRSVWAPALGLAYITTIATLGRLHAGNILLGSLALLDLYNVRSRQFLRTFLPCIITGALYDSFRFFLRSAISGHIHVAGPYVVDRAWFGVDGGTLNEVFLHHHWAIVDLVAGAAYLVYVFEYLAFGMVLFFRGVHVRAHTFARGFLVVNLMGFITYLLYPAAPPWYVTAHGFGTAQIDVAPSPGAGQRFDELLGTPLFRNAYGHSIEVFGALPSLHVAYPVLAMLLVLRTRELQWARWPAVVYALIMCFSAVYLQHHYVIDVLLGAIYAVLAAAIVLRWERRRP